MSTAATLPMAAAPARPATNKWLVTVSVTFGTLMGAIDSSIVNVALPQIRGAVGATVQEITWITTGFAIATVIVMPLTAFLGRLFGQKRVYMLSLAIFIVGSALCGVASSLEQLVIFRALQGFGAGALQPTEQAILRQTFPPKEQGMAMALFGMAVMVGPAIGPTLGGYIVDNYHWSWIFFINLPVGVLGLFMVWRFVHEPEDIRAANQAASKELRGNLDWLGIALLAVGLAALQFFLEEGQQNDWFDSSLITVCALLSVAALALFVWRELTAKVPAVNLRLFKDPVFTSGTLIGAVMFAILLASMFLLPLFMQELLGFTAMQSGLALMPRVLVMMLVTPLVGRLYGKVSARLLIGIGVLLVAYGAYDVSHITLASSSEGITRAILVQGIGFSFLFVPLTTAALSNVPRARLADATGLNSLLRQVGASMGLAIFATLLSRWGSHARGSLVAHLSPDRPEVQERLSALAAGFAQRGFDPVSAREAALRALDGIVTRQSMVIAFEQVLLLTGICFLCVLPLLFFLKVNRRGSGEKVHVEMEM
ncbi:DHA2 family efflux MFS transporter permease subunit [Anaeromyxobacter oryzae]|uniref:EmrB/QacA family drug resistance transporter n=1 Tax=Anaeromyxobacter oryzae TaxID=2918170 RepID=A0ABM7X3Q1_9BACT|nr:DHA2 family efflux MFS transporter permease subunit [Anaeromyxobacter oryzae]BDG06425.1 EmrB/QacA family drug resistance transporter [Anaeromyxobacter oryzae]